MELTGRESLGLMVRLAVSTVDRQRTAPSVLLIQHCFAQSGCLIVLPFSSVSCPQFSGEALTLSVVHPDIYPAVQA